MPIEDGRMPIAKNRPSYSSFVVVLDKRGAGIEDDDEEEDENDLRGLQGPFMRRSRGCNAPSFSFQLL